MEMADTRGNRSSLFRRLTRGFDLSISSVVWFARICIHFLVHLQGQARDISRLFDPDDRYSAQRILVNRTRLLVLFIRSPHRPYQSTAGQFLAGALTSPVGVGRIDSRRFNLRVWDARIMA